MSWNRRNFVCRTGVLWTTWGFGLSGLSVAGAERDLIDPVTRPRSDPINPDPITINPVDEDATELDTTELDGPMVDLKKQLETGLMARRDKEFAFIRRVVLMVQNDQLSQELVTGTFHWARNKRPYPFPYFQKALRVRAAREGVRIQ